MAVLIGRFECGNCADIKYLGNNSFSCSPDVPQWVIDRGSTNLWFPWHAKLEDAEGQDVRIHLRWPEFDRSRMKSGVQYGDAHSFIEVVEDIVFLSYDAMNWERVEDVTVDGFDVSIRLTGIKASTAFVAVNLPYTLTRLRDLIRAVEDSPYCAAKGLRHSYQGRSIPLLTVTDPLVSRDLKKSIFIQGAQHASEYTGCFVIDGMVRLLATSDDPHIARLRQEYIFHFIPVVDVDALFHGAQFHPSGKNPNRDWVDFDLPETRAIRDYLCEIVAQGENLALAIDMHNGWHSRKRAGASLAALRPENVTPEYHKRQLDLLNALSTRCDYLRPGSLWYSETKGGFQRFVIEKFGCQAHTFEFSRFNIWDRALEGYVPLTQERLNRLSADLVNVLTTHARA